MSCSPQGFKLRCICCHFVAPPPKKDNNNNNKMKNK